MKDINNSFDFDSRGWNINFQNLLPPERNVYPYPSQYDKLFESPGEKYACLFYSVDEYRMGAEAGLIGIFESKGHPLLVVNPKNQWFDYRGKSSVAFVDNFIFVRKLAYNQDEKLSGTPFVVFDMAKKAFGFIDFDWSSIYYSPVRVLNTIFKFNVDEATQSDYLALRHTEEFDIAAIRYYPFEQAHNLMQLYFDEKRGQVK